MSNITHHWDISLWRDGIGPVMCAKCGPLPDGIDMRRCIAVTAKELDSSPGIVSGGKIQICNVEDRKVKNIKDRFYPKSFKTEEDKAANEILRAHFGELADLVVRTVPDTRQRSLVLTKLEEAQMWATKAYTHG